jgi:hypothetical protein
MKKFSNFKGGMRVMNKKTLIAVSLIACVVISMFIALQFGAYAQPNVPCTIEIVPSMYDIEVCSNFVVDVNIVDFNEFPVYDYEFILLYDPAQMSVNIAYDGDFLVEPVTFWWSDDPGLGQVFCQGYTTAGGATGSGTLASVEFHCDEPGEWTFDLLLIQISDENNNMYTPDTVITAHVTQWQYPPALVSLDPPTYTVPICVPFTVNVMITDVVDLYSFQLKLSYDNTAVVDCLDIADGGFLLPPTMETHKLIDDSLGIIEFDLTSTAAGGIDGSGILAKIKFHCTGAGDSNLHIDEAWLYDSTGLPINRIIGPSSRVIQKAYWEPVKLIDLAELPYAYWMSDAPFVPPGSPEGYAEIKAEIESKGYVFDPAIGGSLYHIDSFFDVYFEPGSEPFEGQVTSWWSANTLEDGTRACMLSAEWNDPEMGDMAMGFVTNLLPPEQIPDVDPYIIVNAQPYLFVRLYWWARGLQIPRIITWSYWWYDSHSHPNWFWGVYWYWRVYTKAFYYPYTVVPYWRPWWSWWWHWVYWGHWHWWSTYFPYDP